jgi:ATP-dependent Clp protease ATP-binding subunit ClpC
MLERVIGRLRKLVRGRSGKAAVFERFTDRSRKVMALANQAAIDHQNEYIGTEHILLGLLNEGGGVGAGALKLLVGNVEKLRAELELRIRAGPIPVPPGKRSTTIHTKRAIQAAIEEARLREDKYIGTEHLLLGLLRQTETVTSQVMMSFGISLDSARAAIQQVTSE